MYKRIISRVDIKNGNLVKGISLEGVRNLGDPDYFSKTYYEDQIDEMHFHNVIASLYFTSIVSSLIVAALVFEPKKKSLPITNQ